MLKKKNNNELFGAFPHLKEAKCSKAVNTDERHSGTADHFGKNMENMLRPHHATPPDILEHSSSSITRRTFSADIAPLALNLPSGSRERRLVLQK